MHRRSAFSIVCMRKQPDMIEQNNYVFADTAYSL